LAILTATRTNEVIGARWEEFDLASYKTGTIPANRMKAGKQRMVPLSDGAIKLLKALPREGSHGAHRSGHWA